MSIMITTYDKWLQRDIQSLKERIMEDSIQVMDVDGMHHEFVSGMHGQKLDFDKILTGTDFYIQWVSLYARAIKQIYGDVYPAAIVGIANGANRLAKSIAPLISDDMIVLSTEKVDAKTVKLTEDSVEILKSQSIESVLIVEDVGTTGSTTVTAVHDLKDKGVKKIEALNGWVRTESLVRLDEIGLPYYALIHDVLPVFSPDDCERDEEGFCKRGFEFVPHAK